MPNHPLQQTRPAMLVPPTHSPLARAGLLSVGVQPRRKEMIRIVLASLALLVTGGLAFAQPVEPTQPLLTNELLRRIDPQRYSPDAKGVDKLMEAELLELLPIGYRVARPRADSENDWIIVCTETTEFEFEFTDGKISSHSATFHPAAKSKNLTLERFQKLKEGMTRHEVEKLFGQELSRVRPSEKRTGQVERWRYVRGRELEIYIANGKVTGAHLKAYMDE